MKANEIRTRFLSYFSKNGHTVVPSSSIVPYRDPTLLFVNAGMNQFKDMFLGLQEGTFRRAVSVQKCVRAGGKHNDLENVGVTPRHHTFFEMLGNFSFGDYFKKEAIQFGWQFLTTELGLNSDNIAATIFEGDNEIPCDDEAKEYWTRYLPEKRILSLGRKDNFWSMGDTGPCGPCSEIYYFQGNHISCEAEVCLGITCECDRWLEIWNLVFMQFNRNHDGVLSRLPTPSVDTGMGLERISAIAQNVDSNYDTDVFCNLIRVIEKTFSQEYRHSRRSEDISFRVIADHVRATTFLIADGVMPSNDGRGYVLRKIMRRSMRHGKKLGQADPFLYRLSSTVIDELQTIYPDLILQKPLIERVIKNEEQRFGTTLMTGIATLEKILKQETISKKKILPGKETFMLYDTFGMPLDLLTDIAKDAGIRIDEDGFHNQMADQRRRARESWKGLAQTSALNIFHELRAQFESRFEGYETIALNAQILALTGPEGQVSELAEDEEGEVFLDVTPFYPEGGGQIGDRGIVAGPDGIAEVMDTQSPIAGLIVHHVKITRGSLGKNQQVSAKIDQVRRSGATCHHTITHALHASLRETLGPHVKQAGSLVTPHRLRFDFSHFAPLTSGELEQIEGRVNEKIQADLEIRTTQMNIDAALAQGAIAFFGEKYGSQVRVVEIPEFSLELCGGTHLQHTGEAGLFVITSESSIASGIRRIDATTGLAAVSYVQQQRDLVGGTSRALRVKPEALISTATRLRDELQQKVKEVEKLKLQLATGGARKEEEETARIGDILLWTPAPLQGFDKKQHRQFVDAFKNKYQGECWVAVSASVNGDKVAIIVEISDSVSARFQADQLIEQLTPIIEGRGGGKSERAEAGGRYPERLPTLYNKAREIISNAIKSPGA